MTLSTDERMRKTSGMKLLPMARSRPAQTLAEHIRAYGCTAEAADSIEAGVARAEELGGEGPVCALGTLYFSGDVRQAFAKINKA